MIKIRRLAICLGIFILWTPFLAFAGTVGNTATVDAPRGTGVFSMKQDKNISIKAGADLEFLFDRDIHANAASGTELTSAEWYMAKLSCVIFNRFEPYLKLGVAHMKAKWNEAGTDVKLESNTNFAWGLGGKVLIWDFERPKLKILSDGFYRMADLDGEEGHSGGSKVSLDTEKSRFVIREWQIALLAAGEIDIGGPMREEVLGVSTLIPYAGIKYSDINGRLRLTYTSGAYNNPGEIEGDDNFGVFVGCDIVGPNAVSLNVEARFIDETAVTTGLAVLF